MKQRYLIASLLLLLISLPSNARYHYRDLVADSSAALYPIDSLASSSQTKLTLIPKRPWRAAAETFGVNMAVWAFDRYVMNEEFARISWQSIKNNFRDGFGWDNDKFITNLFAHPYHGSIYYNSARSNGLSFWQSIPYTVGGSLMWELFMENEAPSTNDLVATTFGGIALGEFMHRFSDHIIDDRARGSDRVVRELLGAVLNPSRFLNRLIDGQAFRYSPSKASLVPKAPIEFTADLGLRFLADHLSSSTGAKAMALTMNIKYDDPFSFDYFGPYDWFKIRATLNISKTQPILNQINIVAPIWGKEIWQKNSSNLLTGIFQHFDYYNSEKTSPDRTITRAPYRIAQVASFGSGLIFHRLAPRYSKVKLEAEAFASAILLGASISDHYFVENRDYNIGSGFSIKSKLDTWYNDRWNLQLGGELYHLYTWVGADGPIDHEHEQYYQVQGDISHSRLVVATNTVKYKASNWYLAATIRHFKRKTNYRYFEDVSYAINDWTFSLGFIL